ncbi:MAG TPA: oxygen-independent coproporphyrinogen III oxidase [Oligoflexia bacterium]|nr:oxygen-independent coproporphyrinogen III oxidase [Oligoflexia bacterium]
MTPNNAISSDYEDGARIAALAEKYAGAVPRYTSYPTAVEFSDKTGVDHWKFELQQEFSCDAENTISLYIHIPFCKNHCFFCACNKTASRDPADVTRYLDAVKREIASYSALLGRPAAIEQIHWGGGTPNFLTPAEISSLHDAVVSAFGRVLPNAEISFEADPRTLTREHLATLAALGFNRLSLGIQDFSRPVQEAIGRVQPFELTQDIIAHSREQGLNNINVDLIYGLPLQDVSAFDATINQVLDLQPNRVALYGYAHVTWIKRTQLLLEKHHLPSPKERIALFCAALKRFTRAGYDYIGLDHFALPGDSLAAALREGKLNRTFMGYTTHKGSRLIALGASGISILPRILVQNSKDLDNYCRTMNSGEFAVERGVIRTGTDQQRAEIIDALLCQGRIDIRQFESRWQIGFADEFASALDALQPMVEDNLVRLRPGVLELTALGRLFARNAASPFDAYLDKARKNAAPVFSQAV